MFRRVELGEVSGGRGCGDGWGSGGGSGVWRGGDGLEGGNDDDNDDDERFVVCGL